jgi:peptidoglycan/LPS O-acetylase OafA/YrhL
LVVLVIRRWRRAILPCTLVLAGLSSALPLVLWRHGRGADRIYFGSDTRAQALLAGALLAELWATGTLERWLGRRRRAALAGVGAVVLASLILRPHDGAFKYGGAFTMASLAGGVVVGYLVDEPGNWASRALSSRPLRWLGERSYGLYLWHWVLLCWTCHLPSVVAPVVAVGGAGVVAEASWRVVERPVMRGAGKRPSRPPPERAGAPPVAASVTAELANAG